MSTERTPLQTIHALVDATEQIAALKAALSRKDAEIEALIGRLKQQAELCNFKDDHDHELKMNAAYLDLITYKP